MSGYGKVPAEVLSNINTYIKKGEKVEISDPVKFYGGLYRKVVFHKGFMGKLRGQEEQFLFVNEKNEVLDKSQVQRELTKLFHYYEIFFDENNRISIYKTLQTEEEIKKDENDYEDAIIGLKIIGERFRKKEEIEGLNAVLEVMEKVPELRKKNNEKLKKVINLVENMKKSGKVFDQECLDEIYPFYKEALMLNFKKIKTIYPCGQYYNKFKKTAEKTRKLHSLSFRTRYANNFIKANYIMSYFDKMLHTYSKILDMNEKTYERFLREAEASNVNIKMSLLRNK